MRPTRLGQMPHSGGRTLSGHVTPEQVTDTYADSTHQDG
jgi:hypothetical protein